MTTHSFTLHVDGVDLAEVSGSTRLDERGLGDASLAGGGRGSSAEFDRPAESLIEAIVTAIVDVERLVPGARVLRVDDDDTVAIPEIARRLDRTTESARLWTTGARGAGGFPRPVPWSRPGRMQWRWAEVAEWVLDQGLARSDDERRALGSAHVIATINGALQARNSAASTRGDDERQQLDLAALRILTGRAA